MTLKEELGKLTDDQMRGIITANLNQPGSQVFSYRQATEDYPGLTLTSPHLQRELLQRGYNAETAQSMTVGFVIGMQALIKAAEIERAQADFPDMPPLPPEA